MSATKTCATCDVEKPVEDFPRTKSKGPKGNGKTYTRKHCRPCVNANELKRAKTSAPDITEAELSEWYQKGCKL